MIQIQQLKLPIEHTNEDLKKKICKTLRITTSSFKDYRVVKRSIDARKRKEIQYVYTIYVNVENEKNILNKIKNSNVSFAKEVLYQFKTVTKGDSLPRPVIVGSGPAGLFCAYILAENGFAPIIIERGKMVEERSKDVADFWTTNKLNLNSNVQFGEGGAGTFSDGKLNTLVKDQKGRNKKVLDIFIQMGAPKEIAYINKPHIGTDILQHVVKNMREMIKEMGGTFYFETCVTDLRLKNGKIDKLILNHIPSNNQKELDAECVILAIGHSARDTFSMLFQKNIEMEAKSFAVGLRVEHPQILINKNQYGENAHSLLPVADYKLNTKLKNNRGVYSFCMCPGGYVVNASSEEKMLAINGMSYSKRDGKNANSAIIVSVTPSDFLSTHPLSGIEFQRKLEKRAYDFQNGSIPQQLFGDFVQSKNTLSYGEFESTCKGNHAFAPLHELFPQELTQSFVEGMHKFSNYIENFNQYDCILSGVESRTSSPVRILRDEYFESNIKGIYPCGEGAGYAGGIMSAAMDGLKVAECVATCLQKQNNNKRKV